MVREDRASRSHEWPVHLREQVAVEVERLKAEHAAAQARQAEESWANLARAITNAARAGRGEMALTTIAGHSDSRITRRYTHLAGVMFADEAERMGGSDLWSAATSRKSGRKSAVLSSVEATEDAD